MSVHRSAFIAAVARMSAAGLVMPLGLGVAAEAQTAGIVNIRVGTPGGESQAGAWYAQDAGFFRKHNLDAAIETIRGSGAGNVSAMIGGAVDIGPASFSSFCSPASKAPTISQPTINAVSASPRPPFSDTKKQRTSLPKSIRLSGKETNQ